MDLNQLRDDINTIDEEILRLFEKRMGIAREVALYKIKNGLDVFQSAREKEIISKVRGMVPDNLKNGAEILFNTIMDISKSRQYQEFFPATGEIKHKELDYNTIGKIACPGTYGSYSQIACGQISQNAEIKFYNTFLTPS